MDHAAYLQVLVQLRAGEEARSQPLCLQSQGGAALMTGISAVGRGEGETENGEIRWVVHDVTDRRQAEQRVRAAGGTPPPTRR